MIDIKKIIDNKEKIIENLNKRNKNYTEEINEIHALYNEYLSNLQKEETFKSNLNKLSKEIGVLKKQNLDATHIFEKVEKLKTQISTFNTKDLKKKYEEKLLFIPNILSDDVPFGNSEDENKLIRTVGEIPEFNFPIKEHFEIEKIKEDFNFEIAHKISKSRFVVTKNFVAKLERAISNFMLDLHGENGYIEHTIPLIVAEQTLQNSGQLPKFKYDAFKIDMNHKDELIEKDKKDFYLIPTAEVVLANLHQNQIINSENLPYKYVGYSQCFRKEVGSAGKDITGIIRMHQFGKVELFKYVTPENTLSELEKMVNDAELVLKKLNLPYRVIELCSGDIGFSAEKTFDIEVWFPAQNTYRECSSCSSTSDFQARRGKIRYTTENNTKKYPHLLNGSGMATGRILAAILENYQQEDGTVQIPEALKPYFNIIK